MSFLQHIKHVSANLIYIKHYGVKIQQESEPESFNCIKDKPNVKRGKISIKDFAFVGGDLDVA